MKEQIGAADLNDNAARSAANHDGGAVKSRMRSMQITPTERGKSRRRSRQLKFPLDNRAASIYNIRVWMLRKHRNNYRLGKTGAIRRRKAIGTRPSQPAAMFDFSANRAAFLLSVILSGAAESRAVEGSHVVLCHPERSGGTPRSRRISPGIPRNARNSKHGPGFFALRAQNDNDFR